MAVRADTAAAQDGLTPQLIYRSQIKWIFSNIMDKPKSLIQLHPISQPKMAPDTLTAHGMRSMFRSWAAATRQDRELVELAMGHVVYGASEGAYVRDPLHEQRAELMDRWALHCRAKTADILPMRA